MDWGSNGAAIRTTGRNRLGPNRFEGFEAARNARRSAAAICRRTPSIRYPTPPPSKNDERMEVAGAALTPNIWGSRSRQAAAPRPARLPAAAFPP